jgi:hypothetical protein
VAAKREARKETYYDIQKIRLVRYTPKEIKENLGTKHRDKDRYLVQKLLGKQPSATGGTRLETEATVFETNIFGCTEEGRRKRPGRGQNFTTRTQPRQYSHSHVKVG